MTRVISKPLMRTTLAVLCIAAVPNATMAQSFPQAQQQPQLLTPDQLESLVAPIALYPDPLLSQVLAASTYPLEIVEAQQWLQQKRNLSGQQLVEAAKQQNWDPSVQLLVAFPEVMALVTRDIRWTTDLGNAFLGQQADVMNAIQELRSQASNNGRLRSTPEQIVSTETQNDESAIEIQPANPQVLYPPVYNPSNVWGPQVGGAYGLSYPQGDYGQQGGDYGSGFGSGTDIGGLFSGLLGAAGTIGSGLMGSGLDFGAWGWVLNWFTHGLFLNGSFFNGLGLGGSGFSNYGGGFRPAGGFGGDWAWAHNPAHRSGVTYSNGFVSARYRGGDFVGRSGTWRMGGGSSWRSGFAGSGRSGSDGWHRPGFNSLAPGGRTGQVSPGETAVLVRTTGATGERTRCRRGRRRIFEGQRRSTGLRSRWGRTFEGRLGNASISGILHRRNIFLRRGSRRHISLRHIFPRRTLPRHGDRRIFRGTQVEGIRVGGIPGAGGPARVRTSTDRG